ncbi:MAG: hypothetical protein FJW39_03060 [Acidobacteria bacterium]|nr:hypothetical protein [Acidobacteriota bacterium]
MDVDKTIEFLLNEGARIDAQIARQSEQIAQQSQQIAGLTEAVRGLFEHQSFLQEMVVSTQQTIVNIGREVERRMADTDERIRALTAVVHSHIVDCHPRSS